MSKISYHVAIMEIHLLRTSGSRISWRDTHGVLVPGFVVQEGEQDQKPN